jgi:hypothetical protein
MHAAERRIESSIAADIEGSDGRDLFMEPGGTLEHFRLR